LSYDRGTMKAHVLLVSLIALFATGCPEKKSAPASAPAAATASGSDKSGSSDKSGAPTQDDKGGGW
jgi:hypothetical protein